MGYLSRIKTISVAVFLAVLGVSLFSSCDDNDDDSGGSAAMLDQAILFEGKLTTGGSFSKDFILDIIGDTNIDVQNPLEVTVGNYGMLRSAVGDKAGIVDQLKVAGPVDGTDLAFISECSSYGKLRYVDLSGAQLKGDRLPDRSFASTYEYKDEYGAIELSLFVPLYRVVLPAAVKEIGSEAFSHVLLTEFAMPESLVKLKSGCFSNCMLLGGELSIPEGVSEVPDEAFMRTSSLESIVIAGTVDKIGEQAFFGTSARSLTICEGVREIEEEAFMSSRLEEVSIPSTLQRIEPLAFGNMDRLKTIRTSAVNTPDAANHGEDFDSPSGKCYPDAFGDDKWFDSTPHTVVVYVPDGAADKYASSRGWDWFSDFR